MKEPILVVLAAGMGSRYGGLKQIDPIGPNGEIILELSVYDALQAGFKKVVFIIKKEIEKDFKEAIGNKISQFCEVVYVYQELDKLPAGCALPNGRKKPWGTSHALLCCRDVIDAPFAVINADDYYGKSAFVSLYDFLCHNDEERSYAMVGYILENTVSLHGSVARGVCSYQNGRLTNVRELNMWGFKETVLDRLEEGFLKFFAEDVLANPMGAEDLIPVEVGRMLRNEEIEVHMLSSRDKWYGVTYQEDKPVVKEGIRKLLEEGQYPQPLWK